MKRSFILAVFFIGLCVVGTSSLDAQTTGGTLSGKLSDSTGAARPGATITLENIATGQRVTATTDTSGFYRFENIPAGRYRVVSATSTSSNAPVQEITVGAGQPTTLNLTLAAGPATDTFMTAETVPTRLSPATLQSTYNTQSVQYLPQSNYISRDGSAYGAYNLSMQTEGVQPVSLAVNGTGLAANAGPSVVGERPTSNNYHIDGIDNNNKLMPGPLVYLSNEATSEFTLFHNQPSPTFGHAAGGKFNSMIRSGSNRVHGQIYDYLQNRNLNARDQRFSNIAGDLPRYDQNRLGGSLGLPVIPSKLFFFGNFEWVPLRADVPFSGTSMAPAAAGFSTLRGISGISNTNLGILQNALGNNVGPAMAATTVNGVAIPVGQIQGVSPVRMDQYFGTGALDFTPWDKDRVSLRYVHNEMGTNNAFAGGLPAFSTGMRTKAFVASGAYYHTFANAVTNELRFGFNRYTQWSPLNSMTSDLAFPDGGTFPNIQIGGESNFGLGQQFATAQGATFNTYHLADGLSMRIGGHDLRIGFDGRRYMGRLDNYASNLGMYSYSSLGRFLADLPPDVASSRSFFNGGYNPNQWLLNGYVQDTYNFSHRVQVDVGLRYEYATIPTGLASQRFNNNAGVAGLIDFNEPRSQATNFAPYIGIAFSPFNNYSVFRAGTGVFYDTLYAYQNVGLMAPGLGALAYSNTFSNTPGFLANGGIQNPNATGAALTPEQARAQTSSWFGNQRTPYSWQWNAAWQQAIWHNFNIEFKYMGARGFHQPVWTMLNPMGTVTAQNSLPLYMNAPAQAELNALPLTLNQLQNMQSANPFVAAGFTNPLMTIAPDGNSWYHGATVSLDHSFTGGFQFRGNYTWSHLIDDATGTPLDLMTTSRIRSNSLFDRRHVASATAQWAVGGAFRNTYNWVRNVLADFSLAGTYTFASGQFLPVATNAYGLGNAGFTAASINANGIAGTGSGVTPLRNSAGQIVAYQTINPNAQFIAGAPGIFNPGNRASLQLEDINTFDVSAVKRFNFAEKASLEFRGDAYNVLNRRQITGSSATAIGSRFITMPGLLNPSSIGFGNFGSAFSSNPRILQVAARITF